MKVFIRTELVQSRGIGHWMRMWSLSQWLRTYELNIHFIIEYIEPEREFVINRLAQSNLINEDDYRLIPAPESQASEFWFEEISANDFVVIDSYVLNQPWLDVLSKYTRNILLVDDDPTSVRTASVLVDPTAREKINKCKLKMDGARYFFANPVITKRHFYKRFQARNLELNKIPSGVNSIFVSFGGSDTARLIPYVIGVLIRAGFGESRLFVAVSEGVAHEREILEAMKAWQGQVTKTSDVATVIEHLSNADLAIGAAGGMAFERALMGVPAIAVDVADNQSHIFNKLKEENLALTVTIGEFKEREGLLGKIVSYANNPSLRQNHRDNGLHLLQGVGGSWISQWISQGFWRGCYLMPADQSFMQELFTWQKQASVRLYSRNTSCPTWEEHKNWFTRYLSSLKGIMCKVMLGEKAVGMLRLDLMNTGAFNYEVSILIDPEYQKQGLGKLALLRARQLIPFLNLYSYINPDNISSIKLFRNCGYVSESDNWYLNSAEKKNNTFEVIQ